MKAADKKLLDKCISEIEEVMASVETIRDRLQEEYDGKSEKWQEGEKGEALSQLITDLSAITEEHLTSARDELENAKEAV
jgi:hypothetical protein